MGVGGELRIQPSALSALLQLVFCEMWKTRQKVGLLEFESLIFAILSLRFTLDRQAEMSDRQLNWSGELMGSQDWRIQTGEHRHRAGTLRKDECG